MYSIQEAHPYQGFHQHYMLFRATHTLHSSLTRWLLCPGCVAVSIFFSLFLFSARASAQSVNASPGFISKIAGDQSAQQVFIENIGQYGSYLQGREQMGAIRFGYEGLDMPVLFTPKGVIHLQRKLSKLSHEEEERLEKAGAKEEQIERERNAIDRSVTMEWLGASEHAEIVAEGKTFDYHTYGLLPEKAFGYRQLTYKELYPGIDIVYHFSERSAAGFEYSLVVHPGADLRVVKLRYGGDVKKIKIDRKGNLEIRSDIDGISSTVPVSYYGEKAARRSNGNVTSAYELNGHDIRFVLPEGYDKSRSLVLDPFVSSTSNLTGLFAGKAIDVDYDYAGNVYVAGGGNTNQTGTASHSHAKYNSVGVLQWTFNGVLSIPVWTAGYYYGGWVVDKASGSLYIGQGFAFQGFQVIRVSTTGLYDNYITTANSNFQEDWKMYWYCNNGNPQIICAGGGTTTNNNIAICAPPSPTLAGATNLTGAASAYQDMSDLVIDPVTNSLYTIYASGLDKTIENKIFKHNAPYSAATTAWSTPSGYVVLGEILNRPYLGGSYADNSSNILAVNANYLFYWDGLNLKAIDKASGTTVGTPISLPGNLALRQGGVVADACDNVYIGNGNGTIKVYKFNGSSFDDAAANDIPIPGYSTAVYDLALDESKKLLYASGDGFVASFDVSAYCPVTNYTVTVLPNCVNGSAAASISPAPPPGSTVTYSLFIGNVQVGNSNTTGVFTGLSPNTNYTVVATINLACSGTQASANFMLPGPTITFTQTNTTCGASSGSITAAGSGSAGPYSYSLNGGPFQSSGNFTGLAAGIYTLVVQGAGGCPNDTIINILNSNGPTLTHTQTNATCGSNTGTVTASATGGATPYEYSIDNGLSWQSNNFFTGLTAGDYILAVRDASGCINRQNLTIVSSPAVTLNAIPGAATCGLNNGSITAFGSGGSGPLQYSINGNTFQAATLFSNVNPGNYIVTVKDAIGCSQTFAVTVDNVPPPGLSATTASATCSNSNGSITATGSNGIPPYQYSINGGVSYQPGNVFGSLAPGAYTIIIKDSKGCTGSVAVNVASLNGPAVTATATSSSCAGPTGTITAAASGGAAPYQYSINGTTFTAAATFSNLPPGNYVVFVKDNSGCIATARVIVDATAGPSLSVTATPASCVANNGTITATGSGGAAPLQYSIDGITYTPSNTFSGLASALYTVYVKDANGCIKSGTVIVGNASGLSIAVSPVTSSCSVGNGTLTITATGGIAPLQYSIDGVNYQASATFINLSPGNYTAFVKDVNGCIVSKQTVVSAVAGPSFSLTVQQNATCGSASGVVKVTASGGVEPLSYSIDGGAYQLAPFFVAVAAGTHNITVKDAAGCTAPAQSVTITNSIAGTAITDVTFVVRDVLACIGEGRIKNLKGVPTGGGNNYEFSLDGNAFSTANQIRPVSVGYHVLTARNRNSLCTISKLVLVGKGTPATATFVATPSACGASTGSITITGVGANTPYHASIDNGVTWQTFASTFTFTGLAPGTYPIEMADDADFTTGPPDIPGACTSFIYATVPSTGGPSVSATQTTPTCSDNTATVTATGSGGTGPYTYSIDNSTYVAGNVFTGITPGNHALSVKDATGCTNGITITIVNASAPSVTAVINATSCGENNGSIKATGSGGTAPLEYSLDGTVYVTNNVFSNLKPGSYTLYVRDAHKCFSSVDVTIANTPLPKLSAYSIASTCSGSDGSIVAAVTGGEGPFTFSINGTVYQSSPTFTDLPAGFYTVFVKDARGCTSTTTVSITSTGGPVASINSTAATCGNSNGSITVTAGGGLAPYQYSINGSTYQSSNTFTALAAGNYGVWIKDAGGCITAKNILVANTPGPQAPAASLVHAACGGNNGSISLSASGGTAPLQYSIDGSNFFASGNFTNLPAGNYTAIVKDANGCIATTVFTLQNLTGPALSASSSAASCGKSDGTITSSVSGGTGAISYSIDGVNFQSSSIFIHQPAGSYTLTARDSRGCTAVFSLVIGTIGAGITPTFAPVGPVCAGSAIPALPTTSLNGVNGVWSPAINNTATTTYTFTPLPGQCANITTLTITITPQVVPSFTAVAPVCAGATIPALPTISLNGIAGTWSPAINNAATTTYTFTPDAGQCATSSTLTIVVNPLTVPTFTPIPAVCAGSAIAALPTTSINGITGSWSPAINNTVTTTYTFTPDAGQCATSSTLTIVINPLTVPTFTPIPAVCAGSAIAALPTTSINGITGSWSPAINNTVTTTYTFTPDAGQCAHTTTLTITINPIEKPVVNCGVSTSNSVSFNWTAVPGATEYNISYQTGTGPLVNIGPMGNILSYAVTGLNSGDQVSITVLPGNSSSGCFAAGTATCNANACTPPTAAIQYNTPWCATDVATYLPTVTGTGSFTGGVFSAGAGLSIDATTGGIQPSASTAGIYSITYTVAGTGGCAGVSTTAQVSITALKIPFFEPVAPVCAGNSIAPLPTTSTNGVTGSWSPALNNSQTTVYTFTPDPGQCAAITAMQVVVNPLPSDPTVSIAQANCTTPAATVTISNATPNTLYSLDGAAFSAYPASGYLITVAGAHTLQAQFASGCLSAITSFNTNAAPQGPSSVAIIVTDAACGNNNGSIGLGAVTGGTAPYTFSINGSAYSSTATYTNLAAGTYNIRVKDNNGCVYTTGSNVNNAGGPGFTSIQTASSCGNPDGSITITATGGTAPYQYSKDGTNFQAGNTFSGLIAGSYSVLVKDAAGCISTANITVSGGSTLTASATTTPASCGNADGSITITATAGTAPYQYSKDGTNYKAGNTFTGLIAGSYSITVKDASGCSSIVVVSVTGSNGPAVTATTTAASCGNADGSIVVSGTGGTAPYQYSKDGLSFQTGNAFGSLAAGNYTITVTDAGGCTVTATVTVPLIAGPQLSLVANAASCGLSNGNIVVTATAGTAPYTYAIDSGSFQSVNIFNALPPGSYTISVKDATGCTATGTITLQGSSAPVLSATVSNTTCGNANGTIVANASAGTPGYQFSISGSFQSSHAFSSLSAGTYTLVVKDAGGCTATTVLTVGASSAVTATAITTAAHCSAADGSLTATGSGGLPPYQFALNNGSFQSSSLFTGLRSGNYTLIVKDTAGCTSSSSLTIASVNNVTVNAGPDQTICAGSSTQLFGSSNATQFQWSPANGLSNSTILQPIVTVSTTSTYILTTTMGACSASDTVLVKVQPPPVPAAGNDTSICFGNTLALHGSGGLIYQWSGKGLVSGINTATSLFTANLPGKYPLLLSVTDAFGCRSVKNDTVLVTVLTPVTIFAGRDTSIALHEPLQLHAVPGAGNIFNSYQWSPPGGLNNPSIADPLFTAGTSNVYTYRITATTREGCTATDDITIKVFIKPDLYVPNAFTPNGDGQNDKLRVIPAGIKELHFFSVYSRWGELVFTTKNLSEGWDGMYKGKKQDSGGFVWVAEAVDFSGHVISRKGIAMLLH